jgi:hypothetical protein
VKHGFAQCSRHEPNGVVCGLQSVHSHFLPAEDITPVVMSSSSAYAREEINTRRVMHVANITDRTSERNAK